MLAQGDLAGLLNWQLQDNVKLLDTFYMFWHKAYGRWDFCDDNAAVWEKEIRQFFGDKHSLASTFPSTTNGHASPRSPSQKS